MSLEQPFEQLSGEHVRNPLAKVWRRVQVFRERRHIVLREIDEQAFGDYQYLAALLVYPGEQALAGGAVREVERNPLERALRASIDELALLVGDHCGEVDFDPTGARRKRKSVGPGVQAGGQIED